ncbi:MAG: branched-chain amino acid ABC transporter permease [Burkholderiales bacterium]
MSPLTHQLAQQVVAGIATGSIYACLALAIVMIHQAIDHVNFAQGEIAMFSTYLAWQGVQWGWPFPLAFVAAVALSVLLGMALDRIVFRPLHDAPALSQIVAFIALYALFNSLAGFVWTHEVREFPSPFGSRPLFGSGLVSTHQAGMVGVVLLVLVLLTIFFRGTRVGLAMRASAGNPASARLVGIRVAWMMALGWGMAAGIGAVAGMLIAPVVFLEPNMMSGILLYGLAAAVVGGLSSPVGAVVGGLLVGIVENLVGTFVPVVGSELKLPIALCLIVAVLTIKPDGLFGRRVVLRV